MTDVAALADVLVLSDAGVWGPTADSGGYSILRSTNFTDEGDVDLSKLTFRAIDPKKAHSKILARGDILLERSGGGPKQPVGRVAFFDGDARRHLFGNFVARLRANPEKCDSRYLFWYLFRFHQLGGTERFQKQTTGIRNLEFKRFLGIGVPLPPLAEQRRIVDILNRAAGIRRLRREAREKVRQLIPALFVDMFGDLATNPKGWPLTKVGDLLESADYGTSKKGSQDGNGCPVIRMGNVSVEGDLVLDDLKHVELDREGLEKYRLKPGDLLFNRTNSKDLVGKTGIWEGKFDAVAASYFIRLRCNRTHADPWFVWAFFNTGFMKRRLFETARGAIGQANINAREVKAFSTYLPSLSLQHAFAERVADIQAIIARQDRMADAADHLRESLAARLFDGDGAAPA